MELFLFYLLLNHYSVHAYKILVYSAPLGYSHTTFMGRIADILQEAGHDVVRLTTLPKQFGLTYIYKDVPLLDSNQ
ncbi:unnamed protein product [Heligmosomoides polygyrus]|nr:unnamed protein product [Heligmosomoides polygyrus]VDP61973.1 unnamed protein product [Heligmosomoides polygyrus]